MNPSSIETLMSILILAYLCMGVVFSVKQKRGESFIASFDTAFMWGGGLFIAAYCMDTVAYVAGA